MKASNVTSKVLVHEANHDALVEIKNFCAANRLLGLKDHGDNILKVLKSNIDLGAVLLTEDVDSSGKSGVDLGARIHRMRPELPIFLRRNDSLSLDDLPKKSRNVFAGTYQINNMGKLKELIDSYVFGMHFPNELVRGIEEMTLEALNAAFKGMEVSCDTPYIIKDKFVYGKLFSLMPLEATWCRGYMMFQVEERELKSVIKANKTQLSPKEPNFRDINNLLSEIANMAWGSFKTKFITQSGHEDLTHRIQVPIIINHQRKFVSFGSDYPQLCFRYTLNDLGEALKPIHLYQKLVFSLVWSPEEFEVNQVKAEDLVQSGELELF